MTERQYEDAVQALQRRLGGRWEGLEADGRGEMAAILKRELGYDDDAARSAIEAMIASGRLRYHAGGPAGDSTEAFADKPAPIATSPNATGTPGLPGAGFEPRRGHWEITSGSDSGWEGRAGQVQPR